jgi:hypothetical protein
MANVGKPTSGEMGNDQAIEDLAHVREGTRRRACWD